MTEPIYKIMPEAAWRDFQLTTLFEGSAVDMADGYIHFSTASQLAATLEKHYAGQSDLVVLEVDAEALDQSQLKWEPARGGALFPHLYSALPLQCVRQAFPAPLNDDGSFALPAGIGEPR